MKCQECDQKVTVRNIVRKDDGHISCKVCAEREEGEVDQNQDQAFVDAKNECLAKVFIYTYSQLYKHKIIS